MTKTLASMALVFVAACGSTAPKASTTEKVSSTERVAMLKTAKVDAADAIKTALEKAPGRVADLELHSKGGKTTWEVDIVGADGKLVEVDVDADTGAVADSESPESKAGSAERVALLNMAKVDAADAIKMALEKAPGRVVDLELHSKGGKTTWEVDIPSADGKIVEVDVDAETGAVRDSE